MRQLTNAFFFILGALVGSQAKLRYDCYQQPHPRPHQWRRLLEHPWRLWYRKPGETVDQLGIRPSMTVLELGCGTGVFTVEIAQRIGEGGQLHVSDLQDAYLRQTQQRIKAAGLQGRVAFHHSGAYALPLDTDSIDLAVVIATLGQIPERLTALTELRRVLKPGAHLIISEELPDPAYVPPSVMRRWLTAAGYRPLAQSGSSFCYLQRYVTDKESNTIEVVAKATDRVTVISHKS